MKIPLISTLLISTILLSCTTNAQDSKAVKTGAEVLIDKYLPEIVNRNIGLVMNPIGRAHV